MDYISHLLVLVSIYVILATSFNLLIGFAGMFALAHAVFYGLGAYATALISLHFGLPFPLPLLAAVAVVALMSSLVAFPALRVAGDYLVVISLALQMIVIEVIVNLKELTGGSDGLTGVPSLSIGGVRFAGPNMFLPVAAITALVCFAIVWRLVHSPFGRAMRATRENESATQASGKSLLRIKLVVFAFSAGLASVAGWLYAHYYNYVGPDAFLIDETFFILIMVIVGGVGNLVGSVVGAVFLVLLPELLRFIEMPPDIADQVRIMVYGAILVAVLLFRPKGLVPERASRLTSSGSGTWAPTGTDGSQGDNAEQTVALEGKNLRKTFGGIVAMSNFDITLHRGRITGLIGPNGAGKTTAFNLLTGFLTADSGEVRLNGKLLQRARPDRMVAAGVARSFQDLRLFGRMSVLENVVVALPGQHGESLGNVYFRWGKVAADEQRNIERAFGILRFVGLAERAGDWAEDLSYAEEKLLVVARLLATGADILLFDEPMSGLDSHTLAQILPVLRRLAEAGKAICIIEHNLEVIEAVCDEVYFLDEGRTMATGTPKQIMSDPALAKRYFK